MPEVVDYQIIQPVKVGDRSKSPDASSTGNISANSPLMRMIMNPGMS